MSEYRKKLLEDIGVTIPETEIVFSMWERISTYGNLSEEFIREFKLKLVWPFICAYQNLSENFIREFESKVEWYRISKFQKLSEDFIREFESKVHWVAISAFQQLTDNFIIEFKDAVHWNTYFHYEAASFDILNKFVLKSNVENINELKLSHLKIKQIQIIEKKLALKYMFKNKIID